MGYTPQVIMHIQFCFVSNQYSSLYGTFVRFPKMAHHKKKSVYMTENVGSIRMYNSLVKDFSIWRVLNTEIYKQNNTVCSIFQQLSLRYEFFALLFPRPVHSIKLSPPTVVPLPVGLKLVSMSDSPSELPASYPGR